MEKEKIIELINLGLSQREMGLRLNISQTSIRYWLKKYNKNTNYGETDKTEKRCPKCETVKPLEDFYSRYVNDRLDYGGYCKICSNAYHTNRIKSVKIKMIEYKGGECVDCSLTIKNAHYCVFDFHHLSPEHKDINFDKIKFQKWSKIKNELDKCVLLCANCHRLRHAKIEGW